MPKLEELIHEDRCKYMTGPECQLPCRDGSTRIVDHLPTNGLSIPLNGTAH